MKILGVIPARYGSTRFPGKPLVAIKGQPMVWHVYERALAAGLDEVIVATDDVRIEAAVLERGGKVIMTASEHPSGTDRCGEVLQKLQAQQLAFDFVVNIQGDEPFIDPLQIQQLCAGLESGKITTLAKAITSIAQLQNPNTVKVVWSKKTQEALYFSRYPIPYWRGGGDAFGQHIYYKHVGLYGFDAAVLLALVQLPPASLELAESLEQLRWLENGYRIKVVETELEAKSVDVPEDLNQLTIQ